MKSTLGSTDHYNKFKRDDIDDAIINDPPPHLSSTVTRPPLVRSPVGRSSDIATNPTRHKSWHASDGGPETRGAETHQIPNDNASDPTDRSTNRNATGLFLENEGAIPQLAQPPQDSQNGTNDTKPSTESHPAILVKDDTRPQETIRQKGSGDPLSWRTASTVSVESNDSQRTVRGTVFSIPALTQPSVRTPSYPFPYIPGTPRTWSPRSHQPFTALSPTFTGHTASDDQDTPGKSGDNHTEIDTPAAQIPFQPNSNVAQNQTEDPRFPTPSLYDLVLQINSEPGLEQWWNAVSNILRNEFKADRASLVVPLDPTDIENVPWGQKATFSIFGPEKLTTQSKDIPGGCDSAANDFVPNLQSPEFGFREADPSSFAGIRRQRLHAERLRPRLESRHSYAGHGREVRDVLGTLNEPLVKQPTRPLGPLRTRTHTSSFQAPPASSRFPSERGQTGPANRHTSLSDPDFSSVGADPEIDPHADIFASLRALESEDQPLIESAGIASVLERNRVVTVTRDYISRPSTTPSSRVPANHALQEPVISDTATEGGALRFRENEFLRQGYEEYEQQPASPWTQSPAPSPAIQPDEETNPFFSPDDRHIEESFNPAVSPKDYAEIEGVEAIGIDHANTVLHIPLIHPVLSHATQSTKPPSSEHAQHLHKSWTSGQQRKAPIAILSILSSTVPYPANLTQSLKFLGPHLATSFSIAQQFSAAHAQAMNLRHRRTLSERLTDASPMLLEPTLLHQIVQADLETPLAPVSDSMPSPSDQPGYSKQSPSTSLAGTPGLDHTAHGWTLNPSLPGTPTASGRGLLDNYFEARRHITPRSSRNTYNGPHSSHTDPQLVESPAGEERAPATMHEGEMKSRTVERKPADQFVMKEEKPRKPQKKSATVNVDSDVLAPDADKGSRTEDQDTISSPFEMGRSGQHARLHSYGADLNASFGISSPRFHGTAVESHSPELTSHGRKTSYPEDMPPPSERLLRTIIDSVPVQIFTAQPDTGKLSWVNSRFIMYRGAEHRQILTEPWQSIHSEDRDDFLHHWQRSLRTEQQLQKKVRLQRFDGVYRWFYVRAAPLKDKRHRVVHWIGTMMDFHDQHLAEANSARQQETAASEAKYRALANSSPQIVFALKKSLGVAFCNSQWLTYSGQSESQALGLGFMDHIHPDDIVKCRLPAFDPGSDQPSNVPISFSSDLRRTRSTSTASSGGGLDTENNRTPSAGISSSQFTPMPQRRLSELATTGILKVSRDTDGRPSYSTEVRLKSKDGKYRWHLVRVLLAEPVLGNAADEETWYGTCTDIDDHKTLERDLKETMDEKSRFLSNMSHEIRTPLNGITGMVNFLIDSSLTAEQMEHVNIIRASTEGLRGLINDILDLSKAEAGMIQLNMDWLYVRALIEEVNDLTSAMAIDKGLELNYLVDEDVPPQIKGDRFRIRQILLNVVGNAIKFTQQGEVFVRCRLQREEAELKKDEIFIEFQVIDTGRGFTEKEAEHLFKRFSQIDGSSTRQHGGSGLGLVISQQLAQLHGGDMHAQGQPGQGSTFTFYVKSSLPSGHDSAASPMLPERPISVSSAASLSLKHETSATTPASTARIASSSEEVTAKKAPASETDISEPGLSSSAPMRSDMKSPSASSVSSVLSHQSSARTGSLRSEASSASSVNVANPSSAGSNTATPHVNQQPKSITADTTSIPTTPEALTTSEISKPHTFPPKYPALPFSYFILVVAPLKYSREATVQHINKTLPKNSSHQIIARASIADCQDMLKGPSINLTHAVLVLRNVQEIASLMQQIFTLEKSTTSIVLITDLSQRRKLMEVAPNYDYDQLTNERRLVFVFKPLKPSRLGLIFDPQKERELSTDHNQDSAQQVAVNQKQVFEALTRRLGNRDKRVLLVEDNKVNQMVILKFLAKVSIKAETVQDGVQCTDKVFSQPAGHYSIILCDLHMPNKDGYQTCREIRKWEKALNHSSHPIIALSANVLGDVYQKCVDAGFNSYLTKPVDFKELSSVMMAFMDPVDPGRPHELMKIERHNTASNTPDKSQAKKRQ